MNRADAKYFEAEGRIAYCQWALQEMNKHMARPLSPIERMIDAAVKPTPSHKKQMLDLLCEIVRSKKITGADYTAESDAIEDLKAL